MKTYLFIKKANPSHQLAKLKWSKGNLYLTRCSLNFQLLFNLALLRFEENIL